MADPIIRIKRSSVAGKIPTPIQLPTGEIALNTFDGKLFASKNVGIGTTVFVVNPWTVGTGTNTYDTYFTAGNVGIGSTLPTALLDVSGNANFSGIVTSGDGRLISGIGINTLGGNVGYGITTLDFRGSGISTITVSSGIATINIAGGSSGIAFTQTPARIVTTYDGVAGINTYNVNYQVGYLDTFLNGVRLNSSEFTATDGTIVILNESPSNGDVLDFVYYSLGIGATGPVGPAGPTQWTITSVGINTLSNVGIGTTNPTSKLTVKGNTSLETLNVSGISTLTGPVSFGSSAYLNDVYFNNNERLYIGNDTNSQLQIYTTAIDSFIKQSSIIGNLYIDTTYGLIVRGVFSDKCAVFTPSGSVELYYNNSKKFETLGTGVTVTGTTFTNQLSVSGVSTLSTLQVGTGGTIITTTSGGLVGIGTTNPTRKLDVMGDINSSTDVKIDGVSVLTTASNDAVALAIALG